MGVLDHRKTWHFSVKANGEQCLQAFHQAMANPGFKIMAAKWTVESSLIPADLSHRQEPETGCIATYQGRGGLVGFTTAIIGGQAHNEEQNAVGSQITFAIKSSSTDGHTNCSMWLSSFKTSALGFIADARFFRSSMNNVEKHLRLLDPMLSVDKS